MLQHWASEGEFYIHVGEFYIGSFVWLKFIEQVTCKRTSVKGSINFQQYKTASVELAFPHPML